MFVINQVLPLANHAENLIIIDKGDNRQMIIGLRGQFVAVHAEAAVAGDMNHGFIRVAHLGADGRTQAEAHGAKAA